MIVCEVSVCVGLPVLGDASCRAVWAVKRLYTRHHLELSKLCDGMELT